MADRKSVVQVKFRLRKDVLKQLEKAAKAEDRSINDEIQRRIEQSFRQEDQTELIKALSQATATAAVDQALARFQSHGGPPGVDLTAGRDEGQAGPTKSANPDQKDKTP
jgi:hypothetical protein